MRHASGTVTLAGIALVLLGLAGCAGPSPSAGLIDVEAAKAAAARATTSSIPVSVTSARLSAYGQEAAGGVVAPAGTPVWAIEVTGSFPVSCGPASTIAKACPPPATTALVLIDARTGAFIQALSPAPSRH
jgi:hypothetical protein